MRYKFLFLLFFCFLSLFVLFWLNQSARKLIFGLTDGIKTGYHHGVSFLSEHRERFFSQAKAIAKYQEKMKEYQELKLKLVEAQNQVDLMLRFYPQLDLFQKAVFEPALVISYVEMAEYDRVWLNTDLEYKPDKIYGIVRDGYALGIAMMKNGRLMGMFNGDENCSYGVYIGKNKIPAFIHYDPSDHKKILADYIPQYMKINIGDEVYTSGLDHVFSANIPVGRVEAIFDKNGYITASITPYANKQSPEYLWIINRND